MDDSKGERPEPRSLQGQAFRPTSLAELAEAIELAFDYRGDVTVELSSGILIEGYIFNRYSKGSRSFLQLFPKGEALAQEVPYDEVAMIAFSGEDTASGRSWEAWVAKKESERRAEAEQIAQAAKARGDL